MSRNKVIECIPNFSGGRDLEKIDQIVTPFRGKAGVKLLDYSNNEDHSHLTVALVGEPEALCEAVVEAVGIAVHSTDLNQHTGQHPRTGAMDVIPFIPIKNTSMEEAIELFKKITVRAAELYSLPIFLYEKPVTVPYRENLVSVRKDEFGGTIEKIKLPEWQPDLGPAERHPTAGTVAIGARIPLVAYNTDLSTDSMGIVTKIVKSIRRISGGLCHVKAMGVELKGRNITQVSINTTDYTRTALYRIFELVRIEARRYGIIIIGSEIIDLVPMETLIDIAPYYPGLENFTMQQVLKARIMEQSTRK